MVIDTRLAGTRPRPVTGRVGPGMVLSVGRVGFKFKENLLHTLYIGLNNLLLLYLYNTVLIFFNYIKCLLSISLFIY